MRAVTSETIIQILKKEIPELLIKAEYIRLLNIFLKTAVQESFPFFKFVKYEEEFAIPRVRNYPAYFRNGHHSIQHR